MLFWHVIVAIPATVSWPSLPLCTTCRDYCDGRCALHGPEEATLAPGIIQNITMIRMTSSQVLDLADKDSGTAGGDLNFNFIERYRPMKCRHDKNNATDPSCNGNSTVSWLLKKDLVYAVFNVEVDAIWSQYSFCNLNITGDKQWHCPTSLSPGYIQNHTANPEGANKTDADICYHNQSCHAYTSRRVGWEFKWTPPRPRPPPPAPLPACMSAAKGLCSAAGTNYSQCSRCLTNHSNRVHLNVTSKCIHWLSAFETPGNAFFLCPAPPPLTLFPNCSRAVEASCSAFRGNATVERFALCLQCLRNGTKARRTLNGTRLPPVLDTCLPTRRRPRAPGILVTEFDYCGTRPLAPAKPENQTWVDGHLNFTKVAALLQGSWFSTQAAGECVEGHSPGDGSGCSWRVVGGRPRSVKNYTCVQKRVARAVMSRNPECWAQCPDGTDPDPRPPGPSDCWTVCFFNTVVGNHTLGVAPMSRSEVLAPFERALSPEVDGGCPELTRSVNELT